MKQCPLCKRESVGEELAGTITDPVTLKRCSACGFCWMERTDCVGGKIIVTIRVVKNGNEYYKKNRYIPD